MIKNKICKLFVYSRFRYLQEKAAANCRVKKIKKARLHCNWVIGEGKLVAFGERCHMNLSGKFLDLLTRIWFFFILLLKKKIKYI